MKKIVVDYGVRKELMKMFETTYPTLRNALNFKSDNSLSKKIRKAALNRGGVLLEKSTH